METVCIFSSDELGEIETIKSILEENDIPTLVKNLYTQNLFGGLKIFTGHDAIAGSMQIFVREEDLEKGLRILQQDSNGVVLQEDESGEREHASIETQKDVSAPLEAGVREIEDHELKRIIYTAYLLSILSFLVIPYLFNIPALFVLKKYRKTISLMLFILSSLLAITGVIAMIRVF